MLDVSQGESQSWMKQMAPVCKYGWTRQHLMHTYGRADSAGGWEETSYLENFHLGILSHTRKLEG